MDCAQQEDGPPGRLVVLPDDQVDDELAQDPAGARCEPADDAEVQEHQFPVGVDEDVATAGVRAVLSAAILDALARLPELFNQIDGRHVVGECGVGCRHDGERGRAQRRQDDS